MIGKTASGVLQKAIHHFSACGRSLRYYLLAVKIFDRDNFPQVGRGLWEQSGEDLVAWYNESSPVGLGTDVTARRMVKILLEYFAGWIRHSVETERTFAKDVHRPMG